MAYSSINGTTSSKPYAPSTGVPTDMRSYFFDTVLFAWRPYQSTTEVLGYLDTAPKRKGNFSIFINATGTLSGATFTGGIVEEYWFRTGTTDGDLVLKVSGGGGSASAAGTTQQLQINNGGSFAADARLTFNFTTKTLSVDVLKLSKSETSFGTPLIQMPTIQGTSATGTQPYGHFWTTMDQSYMNGDGQRDSVMMIGYNNDGGGGRKNTNEAGIWWALESHYQAFDGAPSQFEWHIQSVSKDAITNRHFSMNVPKIGGGATCFWKMDTMTFFKTGTAPTPYFVLNSNGVVTVGGSNARVEITNGSGYVAIVPAGDGSGQLAFTNYGTGYDARFIFNSPGFQFNSSYPAANVDFDFVTVSTFANIFGVRKVGVTGGRSYFTIANNGKLYAYKDPAIEGNDGNSLQVKGGLSTDTFLITAASGLTITDLAADTGETWFLTINDAGLVSSAAGSGGGYILPTASASVLGGIKVGTGLSIDGSGVLSATGGGGGGYTLPTASITVLGGVKVGLGLSIDGGGVLSVIGGSSTEVYFTATGDGSTNPALRFVDDNWRWFRDDLNETGNQYSLITKGGGAGSRRFLWTHSDNTIKFGSYIGDLSAASGVESAFFITPYVSQSGTAGYTGLLVNVNTTGGTGSGTKKLLDLQVNGTSVFTVNQSGSVKIVDGNQATGKVLTSDSNGVGTWQTAGGGGYTLPAATTTTLGGIKAGTGLAVDGSGLLTTTGNAVTFTASGDGSNNPAFMFADANWQWFRDDLNSTGFQYSLITKGGGSGTRRFLWMDTGGTIRFGSYIGELSAASGTETGFIISPGVSQSGSASYIGLQVKISENSTGSGTKKILDLSYGSTSMFSVNTVGAVTSAGIISYGSDLSSSYTARSVIDKGFFDSKILSGSASLDFPSTAAHSTSALTITVTGAAVGNPVALDYGQASTLTGHVYTAYVSAPDTVTVIFLNGSTSTYDPSSAPFNVKVFK